MRVRDALAGLAVVPLLPGTAMQPAHEGAHEYAFVEVVDAAFEPEEVEIEPGQRVLWRHEGSAPHDIYADDGSFSSHPACTTPVGDCMRNGDTYEREFSEPGRYPYYCRIHGGPNGAGMSGVVVVTAAEQAEPVPDAATRQPAPDGGQSPPPARDAPSELPRSGAASALPALALLAGAALLRRRT